MGLGTGLDFWLLLFLGQLLLPLLPWLFFFIFSLLFLLSRLPLWVLFLLSPILLLRLELGIGLGTRLGLRSGLGIRF